MRWLAGLALAAAAAAAAEEARAAGPVSTPDGGGEAAVWQDRIVVTAGRGEQRLSEISADVAVLDRGAIESAPARTVDDLLRSRPGFSLFRRAGSRVAHPTTQGVSLRGVGPSGASRTLVLLDGVPLNDPFGGWVYWSQVPRASLDRIEVVSGGGSAVWGSSALGGVIQMLTAPPQGELGLTAEAGERGEAALSLVYGGQRERGALGFEISGETSDGHPVLAASQRGAIDVPADLSAGRVYGRAERDLGESLSVAVRGGWFREERSNGTPLTGNDSVGAWATAMIAGRSGDDREWRGWLSGTDHRMDSGFSSQAGDRSSELPALDQRLDGTALSGGGQLTWSGRRGERRRAGVEITALEGETRESFFWDPAAETFLRRRRAGGRQLLGGAYLGGDRRFGERLLLHAGLRVDRWSERGGRRREAPAAGGPALVEERYPDRDASVASPRLGLVYAPSDSLVLRAGAYRAFRAPTVNELYRPFRVRNDITAANPALDAERSTGIDLGGSFDRRGLSLRLTAFWNRIEDPVANVTLGTGPGQVEPCGFVPAGGLCRQRAHLGRVEVAGAEAEASLRPAPRWRLSLAALVEETEVESAPAQPELEGRRLPQVPRYNVVLAIARTDARPLGGVLQVRWVGEQFEDDLNTAGLAPFAAADLALERRLGDRSTAFVKVENLFGEDYQVGVTADGLVTVGSPRLVRAGLRLRLGAPRPAGAP